MPEHRAALTYLWAFAAGYHLARYQFTDSTRELLAALIFTFVWLVSLLIPIIQRRFSR